MSRTPTFCPACERRVKPAELKAKRNPGVCKRCAKEFARKHHAWATGKPDKPTSTELALASNDEPAFDDQGRCGVVHFSYDEIDRRLARHEAARHHAPPPYRLVSSQAISRAG